MKTIIVPIDFSEYSEYALKAAALLAKKDEIEIIALHMLEINADSLSESPIYAQERTVFLYEIALSAITVVLFPFASISVTKTDFGNSTNGFFAVE